jgi:acid phosphatase type 7
VRQATLAAIVCCLLPACGGDAPRATDWSLLPDDLRGGAAVYGDCRTGHEAHRCLAGGMASLAPVATFNAGDLVENGDDPLQWLTFNAITAGLRAIAPYYPCLGNHENGSLLYFANFDLPGNGRWYSVDVGEVHWLVLDSTSSVAPGSPQALWLAADLAARGASTRHTVALFHHPPYSTGGHAEDEMGLRRTLVPTLREAGVRLAFTGHDHDYERSLVDGVTWVVTGGGGAPLRGQARASDASVIFASVHHFCVVHPGAAGALAVDVWDDQAQLVDRFEVAPP